VGKPGPEGADDAHAAHARYERERSFHDTRFGRGAGRGDTARFYTDASGRRRYRELLGRITPGRTVVEIGCGPGGAALRLAASGADVLGIDLSPVAIARAQQRANNLPDGPDGGRVRFAEMNAESLDLPNASVDLVCGSGVLHHLDLARVYPEIARVLRDDGRAIFLEPLAYNPLIAWYRRRTPGARTHDEHPLRMSEVARAQRWFASVEAEYFDLTSLAGPFLPARARPRAFTYLRRLDAFLFEHVAFLRRYAWVVVLQLAQPRSPSVTVDLVASEDFVDQFGERRPVGFDGDITDKHRSPAR
jgi:SAM-dependent methyltransferase